MATMTFKMLVLLLSFFFLLYNPVSLYFFVSFSSVTKTVAGSFPGLNNT